MKTAAVSDIASIIPQWRALAWRHPEWWAMVVCGGAWACVASMQLPDSWADGSHVHAHATVNWLDWPALGHWSLMIPAMMFPFVIGQLRFVGTRSIWKRRHRAIALFLAGYTVPWLAFGLLAVPLSLRIGIPACLAIAAGWHVMPWRRRAELACHRTISLKPWGWRADLDCLWYGAVTSGNCWVACWAVMLVCAASHRWLWAMPAITYLQWFERKWRQDADAYSWHLRSIRIAACFAIGAGTVYFLRW